MTVYYQGHGVTVHHGDCLDVLAALADASVDAVVTDPPYSLAFMGKGWDSHDTPQGFQQWCQQWATQCLRVLKPGGHLLAFGGTRTSHRLTAGIEDAGFEIRDSIAWLYGSGFPKSLDVSKAIDRAAGAEREVVGTQRLGGNALVPTSQKGGTYGVNVGVAPAGDVPITAPATDAAQQWAGWGTALKPGHEPITVARKPLIGTVAATVLAHGTGALNIDGCRVEGEGWTRKASTTTTPYSSKTTWNVSETPDADRGSAGRWPANLVLTHSADCGDTCTPGCPVAELDTQSGEASGGGAVLPHARQGRAGGGFTSVPAPAFDGYGDTGGASRFFYTAKAGSAERPRDGLVAHPTTKPLSLLRWLVRLVTPPGGTCLDPFLGSGTTAEACLLGGFKCIGIEREAEYLPLIVARVTRRRDPVAHIRATSGDEATLFDLGEPA